MAGTYYKYAERDADSQVNWAEVGKGMSDMLAETNRVREEKKDAINKATRETLNQLAQSPNGEHKGARQSALEYADNASNFVRIQENLLKRGQISLKDYTIARQNINDGTDLAFNALKVYQENYKESMQRYRDGKASLYEIRKREQGEGFGNWNQSGLYINPTNGKVMAAMKTLKIIDGKEVYTMDDAPGKMASVDWVNGMLIGKWDKYDYSAPVKQFTDGLGSEIKSTIILGRIQKQGKITSIDDITSRVDINPEDKSVLFKFITAENDAIQAAMGTATDTFSILADHAKTAPNQKPYDVTNDPEEAKKNPNLVLEVIDPNTGQGVLKLSENQIKDAQEFIRGQMRAQYKYEEQKQVVGAVQRDEESQDAINARKEQKEKDNALGVWGDAFKATTPEGKKAAFETILGTKLAQERGLLDIDTSVGGKITFKYSDPVKNRTLDYDPDTITLRQWNELGNEVHGIDNVADTMKRNKGGDPNMRMGAYQKDFSGVRAGRTPVKDAAVEFTNKINKGLQDLKIAGKTDKEATAEMTKVLEGTGITAKPNLKGNLFNDVNLKIGDEEFEYPVNYNTSLDKNGNPNDPEEYAKAKTATANLIQWIEKNTPKEKKTEMLTKGVTGGSGVDYSTK